MHQKAPNSRNLSPSAKLIIRADFLAEMYLASHLCGKPGHPIPNSSHFPSSKAILLIRKTRIHSDSSHHAHAALDSGNLISKIFYGKTQDYLWIWWDELENIFMWVQEEIKLRTNDGCKVYSWMALSAIINHHIPMIHHRIMIIWSWFFVISSKIILLNALVI
jgi:hypothetical protein